MGEEEVQQLVEVAAFVAIEELEALVVIAKELDMFVATEKAVVAGEEVALAVLKTRATVHQNFQQTAKMVEVLEKIPLVLETMVDFQKIAAIVALQMVQVHHKYTESYHY